MKIVYSHLLNFLEKKPSLEELSDKLFQLGHEHEIEGEVMDLEITPNRGDCLSLKGIARDLNHFYEADLDTEHYDADIPESNLVFENKAEDFCSNISFIEVEIEGPVKPYAPYLENYFKEKFPNVIKEVRGQGFLIGLQLYKDQTKFIKQLMDNKLLTIKAAENVVRILPPLNVTKSEINLGLKIIEKVCKKF